MARGIVETDQYMTKEQIAEAQKRASEFVPVSWQKTSSKEATLGSPIKTEKFTKSTKSEPQKAPQ